MTIRKHIIIAEHHYVVTRDTDTHTAHAYACDDAGRITNVNPIATRPTITQVAAELSLRHELRRRIRSHRS